MNRSLLCTVNNVFVKYLSKSDHKPLFLQMNIASLERGKDGWIFNNMLLKDNEFCSEVEQLIEREMKNTLKQKESSIWWNNLNLKIWLYNVPQIEIRK